MVAGTSVPLPSLREARISHHGGPGSAEAQPPGLLRRAVVPLSVAGLVAAGTALRLVHYLDRRSLWLDEALLALNVASRSFAELLKPLDYNQAAPVLFLWVERLLVATAGVNELALRAFPMAAGIVLLGLLWPVARRLAGDAGALAAVALAALSPALIRYANEVKPYSTDALATVALLHTLLRARDEPTRRRWVILLLTGCISVLVSLPAMFVLAAVIAALALDPSAGRRHLGWTAACSGAWAATVALLYLTVYRFPAANANLQQGYEAAFLVPGPGLAARVLLALRGTVFPTFAGLGSAIPGLSSWWLAVGVAIAVAGLVSLHRRNGGWAAVLVAAPLAFCLGASTLRRYPIGVPRLMVFASPLLILLAASAASWAAVLLRTRARPAFVAAAAVLCAAPMAAGRIQDARAPFRGEDAAALVAAFKDRQRHEEPIYVNARGIPSWVFYTTNWEKPDRERLAFYARAAGSSGPCFENAPSRGRPVRHEGFDLVWRQRGRREILGIPTGRQWRWPSYVKPDLDEGWAANEAERIAREAEPCAWLYFTRLSEGSHKPVMWRLRDDYGAQNMFQRYVPGGVLWRYCAQRPQWEAGLEKRRAAAQ